MKPQNKKIVIFAILVFAAMIAWGKGLSKHQFLEEKFESVSVRFESDGVSSDFMMDEADSAPNITLWNMQKNLLVTNEMLNTEAQSVIYEVFGDMKLVYPYNILHGYNPDMTDYEGCVISDTLAYQLFRSKEVIGNGVTINEKVYKIRGVVEDSRAVVLLRSSDSSKTYKNMELLYHNEKDTISLAKEYLSQNIVSSEYTIYNRGILIAVQDLTLKFPVLLLAVYMLWKVIVQLWKRRTLTIQAISLTVIVLALFYVIPWFFNLSIEIPQEFLPTRWSDFSFWSNKITEIKENLSAMRLLTPVPSDLLFRTLHLQIVHEMFFTTGLLGIAILFSKRYLLKVKYSYQILIVVTMEVLAVMVLFLLGNPFELTREYYFVLPMYLVFISLMNRKGKELVV